MMDAALVAKKLARIETCVHTIDVTIVRGIVESRLGDLLDFVARIREGTGVE